MTRGEKSSYGRAISTFWRSIDTLNKQALPLIWLRGHFDNVDRRILQHRRQRSVRPSTGTNPANRCPRPSPSCSEPENTVQISGKALILCTKESLCYDSVGRMPRGSCSCLQEFRNFGAAPKIRVRVLADQSVRLGFEALSCLQEYSAIWAPLRRLEFAFWQIKVFAPRI